MLKLEYQISKPFKTFFTFMDVENTLCYMKIILSARALHSRGIAHRGISIHLFLILSLNSLEPSNFLFDPVSKSGKLIDFGLATSLPINVPNFLGMDPRCTLKLALQDSCTRDAIDCIKPV